MSKSTYGRIAIALALAAVLLMSPPAVSGGLLWNISIGFGYACVVLSLCLYVFPVRGDGLPHRRLLGLSEHRLIGWIVLGAAAAHVAMLIASEPRVSRYLLPSMPVFMWCGLVAFVLAAVLVQTGISSRSSMRRAMPGRQPARLATLHLFLAALMVATVCAHIAGSQQVVRGRIKTVTALILVTLPLAWFASRRRSDRSPARLFRRVIQISAAALIAVLPSQSTSRFLLEPVVRPSRIELEFPHDRHISVNCATCHHNFLDHTGVVACIECHRSDRTDLTLSSEATFHVFCRDCHARLALEGLKHGPTRRCSECHPGTVQER